MKPIWTLYLVVQVFVFLSFITVVHPKSNRRFIITVSFIKEEVEEIIIPDATTNDQASTTQPVRFLLFLFYDLF